MNKYNVKYKYYSVIIKIIVWIIYASLTWCIFTTCWSSEKYEFKYLRSGLVAEDCCLTPPDSKAGCELKTQVRVDLHQVLTREEKEEK